MASLLVEGLIPAGKPCPFQHDCKFRFERCPTTDNVKEVDFSCAAARLQDLISRADRSTPPIE